MTSKSAYETTEDGERFRPKHRKFREMCCDCGMVHVLNFRIVDGAIEVQVNRDDRATAAARRGARYKQVKIGKT